MSSGPSAATVHLFSAAKAAYQAGNYGLAEKLCNQVLRVDPAAPGVRALLGFVYGQTNREVEAIELLRPAFRDDPASWTVGNALAILLRQTGQIQESLQLREDLLALKEEEGENYSELGLCYLSLRRFQEAIRAFGEAIRLSPANPRFRNNRAMAHQALGDIDQARAAYERALDVAPDDPAALAGLADLNMLAGDRSGALSLYRRSYLADPDSSLGLLTWAKYLIATDHTNEAAGQLSRLEAVSASSAEMQVTLAGLYGRIGSFEAASRCARNALRIRPGSVEAFGQYVASRKIDGSDEEVLKGMEAVLLEGEHSEFDQMNIHRLLGRAYDDLGRYEEAISHFDLANGIGVGYARAQGRVFSQRKLAEWVDSLVRFFSPDVLDGRGYAGSKSDAPILIVGMIRSGTSLVEQILSSHSQVAGAGELSFWDTHGHEALGWKREGLAADKLEGLGTAYLRVLREIAPEAPHVTDKAPGNFNWLGLFHLCFPQGRIIHCRRHPVDNCISIYTTPNATSPMDYSHTREDIVFMYEQYRRVMAHWKEVLPPGAVLDVDYEVLTSGSEPEIKRLLEFCGLQWEDGCSRPEANKRSVSTPSAWQVRQPIYSSSVGRWRNYEPWLGAFRDLL